MDALPEGILEQLLVLLPYVAVVSASQVCRKWKQVIDSRSFARSYKGTVKLVTKLCMGEYPARTYEIADSSNSVLRWAEEWAPLGSVTSHINGLVVKGFMDRDHYIGNVFRNEWEQIPNPSECFDFQDTAIFDLGRGHYRLVYWTYYENGKDNIMTFETGQTEWSITRSDRETYRYTNPVVIGNSVFRVHLLDGVLVEYDSVLGKASSIRITSEEDQAFLDFERECDTQELIVWQGGLYLVVVDTDSSEPQTLEISIVYNMRAKSVQATSVSSSHVMRKLVQLPVRLSA